MKKRSALSMEMVVSAAIVLVVLVVVIAIFGSNIRNFAKGYKEVGEEAKEQARGERCAGFLGDQNCYEGAKCPEAKEGYKYELLDAPAGGWSDCKKKAEDLKKSADLIVCCKKTLLEKE